MVQGIEKFYDAENYVKSPFINITTKCVVIVVPKVFFLCNLCSIRGNYSIYDLVTNL